MKFGVKHRFESHPDSWSQASMRFPRENVKTVEERGLRLDSCGIVTLKGSVEEKEIDCRVPRAVASSPKQSRVLETKSKEGTTDEAEVRTKAVH